MSLGWGPHCAQGPPAPSWAVVSAGPGASGVHSPGPIFRSWSVEATAHNTVPWGPQGTALPQVTLRRCSAATVQQGPPHHHILSPRHQDRSRRKGKAPRLLSFGGKAGPPLA